MNLPQITCSIGSYCSNSPPNFENIRNITKRTLYTIGIQKRRVGKGLGFLLELLYATGTSGDCGTMESSLVKSGRHWDFLKTKPSLDTQTTLKPINELPRCLRIQTSSNGHALHYKGTVEIATLDLASYWGFPHKPIVVICKENFTKHEPYYTWLPEHFIVIIWLVHTCQIVSHSCMQHHGTHTESGLGDPHVVHVKLAGSWRHHLHAGLCNQLGKWPFTAQLLWRDGSLHTFGEPGVQMVTKTQETWDSEHDC